MKLFNIFCDGSFGNRFNVLVSGITIANYCNIPYKIHWPVNNWCGAQYKDIFDTSLIIEEKQMLDFYPDVDDYTFIMHENQCNFNTSYDSLLVVV